jgi:hypothetical protein
MGRIASVAVAPSASVASMRPAASWRDTRCAGARRNGADDDHDGKQQRDPNHAVAGEDRLDDVADRGQLDERAGGGNRDGAVRQRPGAGGGAPVLGGADV